MSKNISLQGRGICHYQRLRATRIHTAPLLPYNIFLFSSLSFNVLLCSLSQFSSDSEETSGENETTDKTYEDEEKKQRRDVNQSYKQIAKKRLGLCATFLFVTLESNNDNDDDNEEPKEKKMPKRKNIRSLETEWYTMFGPLTRTDGFIICFACLNFIEDSGWYMIWNKYNPMNWLVWLVFWACNSLYSRYRRFFSLLPLYGYNVCVCVYWWWWWVSFHKYGSTTRLFDIHLLRIEKHEITLQTAIFDLGW